MGPRLSGGAQPRAGPKQRAQESIRLAKQKLSFERGVSPREIQQEGTNASGKRVKSEGRGGG